MQPCIPKLPGIRHRAKGFPFNPLHGSVEEAFSVLVAKQGNWFIEGLRGVHKWGLLTPNLCF